MKKILLSIELVPSSSWFNNVRSVVTKSQWDIIRKQVYSKAYHLCEICGGVGKKHLVEAHEIWKYDDKNLVQKLEGMISLCPDCHMVKHIGLAQVQGKSEEALNHLMKINKMTKKEAKEYITDSFMVWAMRSTKSWTLDLSGLKSFGIDPKNLKKK
jgi:hypothetical protein